MKKKCVADIMTRLEDIFMLPIETILDFEVLNEIRKQGTKFRRIYVEMKCHGATVICCNRAITNISLF